LGPDVGNVEIQPLECEARRAGRDAESGEVRQPVNELLREPVAQVLVLLCVPEVHEGKDRDGLVQGIGRIFTVQTRVRCGARDFQEGLRGARVGIDGCGADDPASGQVEHPGQHERDREPDERDDHDRIVDAFRKAQSGGDEIGSFDDREADHEVDHCEAKHVSALELRHEYTKPRA
jgi:hypothetical protein